MRRSIAVLVLGLLVAVPSIVPAQVAPGINTPIGPLAAKIVGIDIIRAQIANLRRQLASCDAPGASKAGTCASRALLQAKLNYLLEVSAYLGDPDTAGTPRPAPTPIPKPSAPKPGDNPSDYESELPYLSQQLKQEFPPRFYLMSEERAKVLIINHCERIKSPYPVYMALMSDADQATAFADRGSGKTKAEVGTCVKQYDAKQIVANRKMALEYCYPATTQADSFSAQLSFNICLHRHDMLQAMCRQQLDFQEALQHRKDPSKQHLNQACPLTMIPLSGTDLQALKSASPVRSMPSLPAMFFAPPDVVIPPRPALPIPAGTVVEVKIQGSWNGNNIDSVAMGTSLITATLVKPLVIGGQTVLPVNAGFHLKGRMIGQDDSLVRPDLVQIGISLDEINIDKIDQFGQAQCPCGKYADVSSEEQVFTVSYVMNANKPTVRFDTILRFTIGGTGSTAVPTAAPSAPLPPRPGPAPAAPPAAPDPQQRAEEARKRNQRIQACVQEAIRNNPGGGIPLTLAVSACTQAK